MGLLSKFVNRNGDDDADDLDFEEDGFDQPVSGGGDEERRGGLLGWIRNRGNKGDQDDEEEDLEDMPPSAPLGEADEERPEEPAVQVVRLDGVPDVHPVGGAGDPGRPLAPQNGPSPGPRQGSQSASSSGDAASGSQISIDDELALDTPDKSAEEGSTPEQGLDISLKDIFEEELEVDETLRDLADSMDDFPVGELAEGLRELLADLEKVME